MQPLNYKTLENPWYVLTSDFAFPFTLRSLYRDKPGMDKLVALTGVLPDQQMVVMAPRGFVTDLASIPDALKPLLHPDGPWASAACIHDMLYQKKPTTGIYPDTAAGHLSRAADKDFADLMFLRIMEATGVNEFIRESFYEAVHNFGWPSYTDDNSEDIYKVPVEQTLNYNRNYLFFREHLEPAIPDHERIDLVDNHNVNMTYLNIKRPFIALSLV